MPTITMFSDSSNTRSADSPCRSRIRRSPSDLSMLPKFDMREQEDGYLFTCSTPGESPPSSEREFFTDAAAEREGDNLEGFKPFCLKRAHAKAIIWPWLS